MLWHPMAPPPPHHRPGLQNMRVSIYFRPPYKRINTLRGYSFIVMDEIVYNIMD
jgi:hypothetical protein